MHMVDLAVQPYVEQPVDERVDAGHIFQRPRGIRDVLRLHVVAGRNGDAHLFGDLAGMLAETERRVDMHHVHTIERLAKQRVARLGELHLLLLRHPADQRHMIDARDIRARRCPPNGHDAPGAPAPAPTATPNSVPLPRFPDVSTTMAMVRGLRFILLILGHAFHPTPMAQ